MTATATGGRQGRDAHGGVPVRRLTVLYDAGSGLCRHLGDWLARQRQLVPLELVPAGSAGLAHRYPGLDLDRTRREITVIGDSGQIYRGQTAWITVLWALARHRPTAHRLATPVGAPLARAALLAAAKYRRAAGRPADLGTGYPGPSHRRHTDCDGSCADAG